MIDLRLALDLIDGERDGVDDVTAFEDRLTAFAGGVAHGGDSLKRIALRSPRRRHIGFSRACAGTVIEDCRDRIRGVVA